MLGDLAKHERSVYSQFGEDGVIERIFACIGTSHRFFVDFGARDGLENSNTARLRLEEGWTGLLMEGDPAYASDLIVPAHVTTENVEELFAAHGVPERFDLLSIDIDGGDYWVWKAIERYQPRVVVIEYNIFFGLQHSKTVPYDPSRVWDETPYHGASLAALHKLGRQKGYSLVWTESWSPNAFFVLDSSLPAEFRDPPLERVAHWTGYDQPDDPLGRPWVDV